MTYTQALVAHHERWQIDEGSYHAKWFDKMYFRGERSNMWVVSTGLRVASSFLGKAIEMLHSNTNASFFLVCLAGHENGNEVEYCFSDMEQYYQKLLSVVKDAFNESGGPVNVIGHSLAGLIFLRLACEHPEYVKRMVLFAPAVGLGSPFYLGSLWLVRHIHRFLGGDKKAAGRAFRMWQITPPYEWRSPMMRRVAKIMVGLRLFPPYVWETNDRGENFRLFMFLDWLLGGNKTRLGRKLRKFQSTPPPLQHWRFLRILARALVEWRIVPHNNWSPPVIFNEYVFFRAIIGFLELYWRRGMDWAIRFQRRLPTSWKYQVLRYFHGALLRHKIIPPSHWVYNRELRGVPTLEFPRVPLVAASSIPPFQRLTLRGLQEIKCPVLIIHGTHDAVVPYNDAVWLHRMLLSLNIPSELISMPGGGHSFMLTKRFCHLTVEEVISWWRRNSDRATTGKTSQC